MFRLLPLTIISVVLIYAVQSVVVEKFVSGKITHVGSKDIPKGSKVQIQLQDTSLMDAPAKIIGVTLLDDVKSFPISYQVKYNPSFIVKGHTYTMSARITGPSKELLYINDVHTPADVAETPSPTVNIAVISVSRPSSPDATKQHDKKSCSPLNCRGRPRTCAYGYQKKDGCEICRCNDPCNPPGKPILCGAKERCFVEKKPDGTFEGRCGSPTSKKQKDEPIVFKTVCNEPKVTGHCKAAFPRYYFNSASKQCESFTYGGCQGNGNNFLTKAACEKACKA